MTVRHVERPAAGAPVGALVFFHGYAGAPEEWVGFLDKIDPRRRFQGYLPEAPHVDRDGNRSWFPRGSADKPQVQVAAIVQWLGELPYRPEQTMIGGWSQGIQTVPFSGVLLDRSGRRRSKHHSGPRAPSVEGALREHQRGHRRARAPSA